jgi:lipid A 3-O-deacylase
MRHWLWSLAIPLAVVAGPALADPPADTANIVTLQDENASITPNRLSDRYYVNGLRLAWTSGTNGAPGFLAQLNDAIFGSGQDRIAFDVTQQIYTPANTQLLPPDPADRPYAGVLLGTFSLLHDTDHTRSTLGLSLGIVGPGAGGEQIQNGFHDLIGQGHDLGWGYQIRNTFAAEALMERIWRLPVAQVGGFETDVLPEASAGIGDLRDYVQVGGTLRIGQGLGSDFGVVRPRPGLSGGDAFTPVRPFAWYAFVGGDGQLVGYDMLLDSTPFRGGVQVGHKAGVAEFQGGLAVMAFGCRLTYTQIVQTQEFRNQHGGLHQLGSLALSVRF